MVDTPKLNFLQEYWLDAWQRSILTLDALRQRGNTYLEQSAKNAPNVLSFPYELVRDGRSLPVPSTTCWCISCPPKARLSIKPRRRSSSSTHALGTDRNRRHEKR